MPFTEYKSSLDPETLEAAQAAFDLAWTEITSVQQIYDTLTARTLLARLIIEAALKNGERDPERLKAYAVAGFSL